MCDGACDVSVRPAALFDRTRERIQPCEALELIGVPQPRRIEGASQHGDRLVVHLQRHRERVVVLAAVREREPRRVGKPGRRAVHDLGDERQRLQRARSQLLEQRQRREVAQVAFVCQCELRAQPLRIDVGSAGIVMRRRLDGRATASDRVAGGPDGRTSTSPA